MPAVLRRHRGTRWTVQTGVTAGQIRSSKYETNPNHRNSNERNGGGGARTTDQRSEVRDQKSETRSQKSEVMLSTSKSAELHDGQPIFWGVHRLLRADQSIQLEDATCSNRQ